MRTLNGASTNLCTEGSSIAAREEGEAMVVSAGNIEISVPERHSNLEAKDNRTSKSSTLASEVKPSKEELKEAKQHRCSSVRIGGASQMKGVKQKSLDSPKEQGSETSHHTSNARTERFAEEVEGIGRRLSVDPMRRNNKNLDECSSRFEQGLKLKSSIASGTELYESGARAHKEDGKRIDCSSKSRKVETESPTMDTRGKVVPGFNDDIKQKSETRDRDRWRGDHQHAYLGPADLHTSKTAQTRTDRDRERRTNGHSPSKDRLEEDCSRVTRRRRADFQHYTVTARNGRNHPTSLKNGTFEREDLKRGRGNKLRSVEDLKTRRDVPKRSGEEGDRVREHEVKQSARDNSTVSFDDHHMTRGDKRLPRDIMDRFKPGELEEENFAGRCENHIVGEEDGMHGKRRRHSKDIRRKWDPENGNEASQHGKTGVTKLEAGRYFQSHRLPTDAEKPRAHREGYFKGSTEDQGHSIANDHKQSTRGNAYGYHERHWNGDENEQRDGHRSGRIVEHENNSPRHQRKLVKDDTMERFAGQQRETENKPDLVRKHHDIEKSGKEKLDLNSSPRHQIRVDKDGAEEGFLKRPREIGTGPHLATECRDDQKSVVENVHQNSSLRYQRKIDKDNTKEGFDGQPREAANGPDLVRKNPDDQKCGKENIHHSSSGMRGTHRARSTDTKVVRDEVASEITKGEGNNNRRCSSEGIAPSHPGEQDVGGMTDQNGGNREKASIHGELPESRTKENCKMDNKHNLQALEAAKSNLQEERGGTTEGPRQMGKEVDPGTNVASQGMLHHSTSSPSISEKRKRKDRAEITEALEKPRAINGHSREERPEVQERQQSKSIAEKNSKDDGRSEGTAKRRSFCTAIVVEERMRTDSRASRKSEEALQLKRAKLLRKEANEPVSRRQVVKVDRYKRDVSSQEYKYRKGLGRSHYLSPDKHKRFFSPKTHGKSRSPGRSERDRSSWERFDRERHKSLAAIDSRYRRFGGGTSGLGGYSPRRRRSEAAVKTPSPPPRSPARKKEKAWDSVPPGMDSSMIAAITAAHQAAVQQALAQLVNPLVTNNMLISSSGTPSMANRLPIVPAILPSHQFHLNPAVTAVTLTHATRPLRRLYVGNVPSTVSDGELMEFMNAAMLSANANHLPGTKPCINCSINVDKNHAFAEFITPEDATAALAFDGNGGIESESAVPHMVSSIVADSPHKLDNDKQFPQGFAFLEYMDPSATPKACDGLNGMRLENSILTVVQTVTVKAPFYGIPDHAKTLLEPPTCVLEFRDLVNEKVPNLLEEIEEIIEDVRLECTRFGNVRSTHIVYHRTLLELATKNMPSHGKIVVDKINQNKDHTNVPKSTKEDITKGDIKKRITGEQFEDVEKVFGTLARSQFDTSFDVDDNRCLPQRLQRISLLISSVTKMR